MSLAVASAITEASMLYSGIFMNLVMMGSSVQTTA